MIDDVFVYLQRICLCLPLWGRGSIGGRASIDDTIATGGSMVGGGVRMSGGCDRLFEGMSGAGSGDAGMSGTTGDIGATPLSNSSRRSPPEWGLKWFVFV